MGLKLVNYYQSKDVMVIGDSELIIKGARKQSGHGKHNLARIIQRILKE
jgi:hypothetical protein